MGCNDDLDITPRATISVAYSAGDVQCSCDATPGSTTGLRTKQAGVTCATTCAAAGGGGCYTSVHGMYPNGTAFAYSDKCAAPYDLEADLTSATTLRGGSLVVRDSYGSPTCRCAAPARP